MCPTKPAPTAHLIPTADRIAAAGRDDDTNAWATSFDELIAFGRVLTVVQSFDTDAVFSYLEKPWKWTPEHARWVELGRPDGADVDVVDGLDAVDDSDDEGTNLEPERLPCPEPGCSLLEHDGRHVATGGKSW